MKTEPTNAEKIRRMPWIYAMSATNTIFFVIHLVRLSFLTFP